MTSRVALVGTPLRRRHSEVMHNAAFAHYGIDARYELRPTEADELAGFFAEARDPAWLGFQVTAPHKQAAMTLVDRVEEEVGAIGAINSGLRTADGELIGFNTDSPGFARAVRDDLGLDLDGALVTVAGAGGAARAVIHACLSAGAARVVVGNRTPGRARDLGSRFADARLQTGGLDESFDAALAEADLAVNTTTVGMTDAGLPFAVARLPARAKVFDLVYVPAVTPLVAAARERSLAAVNGLGMLVNQAAIAFERWTGVAGAEDVMRLAVGRLGQDQTTGG